MKAYSNYCRPTAKILSGVTLIICIFVFILTYRNGMAIFQMETTDLDHHVANQNSNLYFMNNIRRTWDKTGNRLNSSILQKSLVADSTQRVEMDKFPRILCWILCDPDDLDKRVMHIKATWAKRCDITLYMSSQENKTFPTIGLNVTSGRKHIASKAKAAWKRIYSDYLDKADFFVKADPDTYLVVENLRGYLSHHDPEALEFFGHRFKIGREGSLLTYNSGGPGQVLSRGSVRKMVEVAFSLPQECMPDGEGEDYKTASCLAMVGSKPIDTRDGKGRETFMVFTLETHMDGVYPDWYISRDPDGSLWGPGCCSVYPIGFHYVPVVRMYMFEYLFYHAKPTGKSNYDSLTFANHRKHVPDVYNKTKAVGFG